MGYPLSVSELEREGPSFLAVGEKALLLLLFLVKDHYALVSGGETWSPVKDEEEEEEEEGWTGEDEAHQSFTVSHILRRKYTLPTVKALFQAFVWTAETCKNSS